MSNSLVPSVLIVASAAICLTLGFLHLFMTFQGEKLWPRDPEVKSRMEEAWPVLTRRTTMWKAWVGFNASHSFGAILFGAVYAYLAIVHSALLFASAYLASLGGVLLAGYLILAKKYWFRAPFRGIALASICYAAGFALSLAR